MLNNLTQEDINEYAPSAQTISEPTGTDWSQGVQVGKTIPAKWWNWLFRAVTKRIQEARADAGNMLAELKNTVTDAGLTPDPTDDTQLAQAANILAERGVGTYIQDKKKGFFGSWTSEVCVGLPTFDASSTVTIEKLKAFDNSEGKAFYICLKCRTGNTDTWYHYTSTDLLTWHEIDYASNVRNTAPRTTDVAYFNEKYYFLLSLEGDHTAYLYASQDAGAWTLNRTFNEYGAIGLRVIRPFALNLGVMWMISATAQTFADIDYNSYYTTSGSSWNNAGTVFRNTGNTIDAVGELYDLNGAIILGNKVTTDGATWAQLTTEWVNSAYSKIFRSAGGALLQFSDDEGAWYVVTSSSSAPIKKLGNWLLKLQGPSGCVLAKSSTGNTAAITRDGDQFTTMPFSYPAEQGAEFFESEYNYYIGNHMMSSFPTTQDWEDVSLPAGATVLQDSGIDGYIIAGNYYSSDACETWVQGISAGLPYCAVPLYISDIATCSTVELRNNILLRHLTFNGINRVIGTTLYLK